MKISTEAINFDAEPSVLKHINDEMMQLNSFYRNMIASDVFLKKENDHSQDEIYVGIKIQFSGSDFFAEEQNENVEVAFQHSLDAIRKQLIKHMK